MEATLDETMPEESDRERRRLHPLLRADALTRFNGKAWSDEQRTTAERAVAAWYARYANATDDAAMAADEENIDGAIDIAAALDNDALLVALCEAMRNYWRDRSRTAVRQKYLPWGLAAAQRIAEASNERDDWLALARLQLTYGDLLLMLGQVREAEEYMEESIKLRQEWNDKLGEGAALEGLGDILRQRGDLAGAQANYERDLALMREVGAAYEEGVALSRLGDILVQRGDLAGAQSNYERVLAIMREVGDRREEGVALGKLSQIFQARGELGKAEDYRRKSLAIYRAVQDLQSTAVALDYLGDILKAQGRTDEAEQCYRESRALFEQIR